VKRETKEEKLAREKEEERSWRAQGWIKARRENNIVTDALINHYLGAAGGWQDALEHMNDHLADIGADTSVHKAWGSGMRQGAPSGGTGGASRMFRFYRKMPATEAYLERHDLRKQLKNYAKVSKYFMRHQRMVLSMAKMNHLSPHRDHLATKATKLRMKLRRMGVPQHSLGLVTPHGIVLHPGHFVYPSKAHLQAKHDIVNMAYQMHKKRRRTRKAEVPAALVVPVNGPGDILYLEKALAAKDRAPDGRPANAGMPNMPRKAASMGTHSTGGVAAKYSKTGTEHQHQIKAPTVAGPGKPKALTPGGAAPKVKAAKPLDHTEPMMRTHSGVDHRVFASKVGVKPEHLERLAMGHHNGGSGYKGFTKDMEKIAGDALKAKGLNTREDRENYWYNMFHGIVGPAKK
jgi:hypothetical protein